MKVLTVRQPWAWALIHGGKDVENRNWLTHHRGPLAIHAGKQFDMTRADWEDFSAGWYGAPFDEMAQHFGDIGGENDIRGAIIGVVDLHGCAPDRECDSPWKADGDNFYCWLVRNPKALRDPILASGQLGIFEARDYLFEQEAFR